MQRIEEIIKTLNLMPHPEGGYYKETYRSQGEITGNQLPSIYKGKRNLSTSIYFLLTADNFSAFHKIHQDEIWYFHLGSPIELHTITESGTHKEYVIGTDIINGQLPQLIVHGNQWFAAKISKGGGFALVSCSVTPGFDFADFKMATRGELLLAFPQHKNLITDFTRIKEEGQEL